MMMMIVKRKIQTIIVGMLLFIIQRKIPHIKKEKYLIVQ
jgi:hypothetical protein